MTAEGKDDYAVGKGRPPLHTRFKPGNRANPAGRPRGARNLKTLLLAALDRREVVVGEDGKRRSLSKTEQGVSRLADRFAKGDPNATRIVLEMLREVERASPAEPQLQPPFDEHDKEVIRNFIESLKAP
jgi:Family of unknown function (DUF5681)